MTTLNNETIMKTNNDIIYENNLKDLIKDKIFRYFFNKTFNNKNYESFMLFKQKERVNFLIEMIQFMNTGRHNSLNVSKMNISQTQVINSINDKKQEDNDKGIICETNHKTNKEEERIEYLNTKAIKKIKNLKNDSSKTTLINKCSEVNFSQKNNEFKSKLQGIMKKYENVFKPSITPVEITTYEIKHIIDGIEIILKNDANTSMRSRTDINLINQVVVFNEEKTKKKNNKEWNYECFHEPNNKLGSSNNNLLNTKKELLNANKKENNITLNKESLILKNKTKSKDNINKFLNINLNNSPIKTGLNEGFLDFSHTQNESFLIRNNDDEYLQENDLLINTKKKKENKFKRKQLSRSYSNIGEIYFIQETLTENVAKTHGKNLYNGTDLLDKIYNCPEGKLIILSSNDSKKLSYLLLDYVKLEKKMTNSNTKIAKRFNEEKQKLYEEIKKQKFEKESLIKEYEKDLQGIKEKTKQKNEVFNDFLNKMNFRIDNSQKYLNKNIENEEIKTIDGYNKNQSIYTQNITRDEEENNLEKFMNNESEIRSQSSNLYHKKKALNKKSSNPSLIDHHNISNLSN